MTLLGFYAFLSKLARYKGISRHSTLSAIKSEFLMIDGHSFPIHRHVKLYFGVIYYDVVMARHYPATNSELGSFLQIILE